MSLRFDIDWQGCEIDHLKDGECLFAKDVKKVLLKIKEDYYEDAELINIILDKLDLRE